MVSADNLNLDVLEMIFSHLWGKDLASVALVSRSFLAGVIPRLYRNLLFRLQQGKKYPLVMSPFASILSHPGLAVHVRRVEIRYIPLGVTAQPHPQFVRDCTRTLALCSNLRSFKYTGTCLPSFLLSLQDKTRLHDLRVNANLTSDQAVKLAEITGLRNLTLECASWSVVDILPKWVGSIGKSLTSLTLYMAIELNEYILDSVLAQLPQLRGLHVIDCARISHLTLFQLLKHTPRLESLSLTTWQETALPMKTPPPPLHHLRHLACDTHYSTLPSPTPSVLSTILSYIHPSFPPMSTFILKFSDRSSVVGEPFIQELLQGHANSLTKITFINCVLNTDAITSMCKRCTRLERLEIAIPVNGIGTFALALSQSTSLQTLVDKSDSHATHGPRATLNRYHIRHIMSHVESLKTIISDSKVWTANRELYDGIEDLDISLERRNPFITQPWFMPCDSYTLS